MSFESLRAGPHRVSYDAFCLGLNNGDLTVQSGSGSGIKSVTRTSEGLYLVTMSRESGKFVGFQATLGALVPADLKGYTVVHGIFSASAKTIAFQIFDSTFTTADIIADQYINLEITFRAVGD